MGAESGTEVIEYSIAVAIWVIATITFGIGEAYYFYHLNESGKRFGRRYDHIYLTLLRLFVLMPLAYITFDVWFIAFALLCFPFIHDGMYYETYNKLKPGTYLGGWQAHVNGRAFFDINYPTRLYMFIASLLILTINYIKLLWL